MTTSFDPAAQLSRLSQQLNNLETDLEDKSGQLQQQRQILQRLNEEISTHKILERKQLEACANKTGLLERLQAQVNPTMPPKHCFPDIAQVRPAPYCFRDPEI